MSTGRFRIGKLVHLPFIMLAIVAVSILAPERPEAASVDCYIRWDGGRIKGESVNDRYKDEIPVVTWGFGENPPTAATTATAVRGTGPGLMQDFRFTTRMGIHSPHLFLGGIRGNIYREILFTCTNSDQGTGPVQFLRITLNDVVIKGYQSDTPTNVGYPPVPYADKYPIDQVLLNFGKIRFAYTPRLPDGKPGPAAQTGWDVRANKPY